MESHLKQALQLRDEKKFQESLNVLVELDKKILEDGDYTEGHTLFLYHLGSAYDCLGEEEAAIPCYKLAIELGLSGDDLRQAYTQLGSSYRCVGEYELAEQTLLEGLEHFPEDHALQVFLAMTHYNIGKHNEAVSSLLQLVNESSAKPEIQQYKRAIGFYAEHIDQVWRNEDKE